MNVVTEENIKIGATVKRGPSWAWGLQDCNRITFKPETGVIIELLSGNVKCKCEVKWTNSNSNSYRIGYENYYDLVYVDSNDLHEDLNQIFK